MGYWIEWLKNVEGVLGYIRETQMDSIDRAAAMVADSISRGHVCYLFGSGHAVIPVMEIFPRYGSFLGFMPIADTALSTFFRIVGDLGYPQFDYVESAPGYGERIVENYKVHEEDCGVVFSHSGATVVTVDVALALKKRGAKVIAVTSLKHSKNVDARHPSGFRLYQVADVVIDTGVPLGDVAVEVKELGSRVGPLSTIAFVVVANLLLLKTLEKLISLGARPVVLPVRGLDPEAGVKMAAILREFRRLLAAHLNY